MTFALHEAVAAVGDFVGDINRYLEATAPWTLAGRGDTAQLGSVLRCAIEATRTAAKYYAPIIPRASAAALERLESDPPRHGPPLFPRLA